VRLPAGPLGAEMPILKIPIYIRLDKGIGAAAPVKAGQAGITMPNRLSGTVSMLRFDMEIDTSDLTEDALNLGLTVKIDPPKRASNKVIVADLKQIEVDIAKLK